MCCLLVCWRREQRKRRRCESGAPVDSMAIDESTGRVGVDPFDEAPGTLAAVHCLRAIEKAAGGGKWPIAPPRPAYGVQRQHLALLSEGRLFSSPPRPSSPRPRGRACFESLLLQRRRWTARVLGSLCPAPSRPSASTPVPPVQSCSPVCCRCKLLSRNAIGQPRPISSIRPGSHRRTGPLLCGEASERQPWQAETGGLGQRWWSAFAWMLGGSTSRMPHIHHPWQRASSFPLTRCSLKVARRRLVFQAAIHSAFHSATTHLFFQFDLLRGQSTKDHAAVPIQIESCV